MNSKMIPTRIFVLALALSMSATPLSAWAAKGAAEKQGQFAPHDYEFADAAAAGGAAEVTLGNIALQKSTDASVRQFGQRMVDDHTKANLRLQEIASRKGATLRSVPSAEEQKQIDHLSGLSGTEFDRAYMSAMVKDHQKDLKEFQKAASVSKDPEVKTFASETSLMVQDHLQMAQDIEKNLRVKTAPSH